ncbi:unnamed protein product [Mytilus coruscus]|uniref:Uncharacterized protein n=1 Tax=Mytilus coruscus TaxID=42192 RepID=A0A6J8D1W1_MYTCO|nr:unnamed protein product [Mytilus coruscus]
MGKKGIKSRPQSRSTKVKTRNKMWVCLNCFELTSAENENCSKCHTARPGSAKAKLFPKELDNRALNARKECNVNKAIGVIKKISNSERTNVKNENDYIDGMKQRQKQDCQGPVMSIIQRECSPGRPPNINPGGHGWQSDTNQGLQKMSTHLGHNKQPNQFHGKNQPPNQYHRRPQRMYANQGLNQQLNKHQGYNQPQNQYQAYNQPQHQQQYNSGLAGMMSAPLLSAQNMNQPQQNFQYVMVQGPVPSVLPSGQGPTPYPALPMLPYNPGKPQEHITKIVFNEKYKDISTMILDENIVLTEYKEKEEYSKPNPSVNVYIALFTTAHARLKLYELLDILQERVLYMDTDSCIYNDDGSEACKK